MKILAFRVGGKMIGIDVDRVTSLLGDADGTVPDDELDVLFIDLEELMHAAGALTPGVGNVRGATLRLSRSTIRSPDPGATGFAGIGVFSLEGAEVDASAGDGAGHLQDRLERERELYNAIVEDRFVLYYQPRVDLASGDMVGMEALLRWMHPARGLVPPNDFIALAESSGAIVPLGELVLYKVCAQLAAWRRAGLKPVPVSVNVSPRQLDDGGLTRHVHECLTRHEVEPAQLVIELTESAMMENVERARQHIEKLRMMGIHLHLDDFGTGHSSLSLLHKLDFSVLKVGREFTSRLGKGTQGELLLAAILSMAKSLGLKVVAEGVETVEQVAILRELGCDEIQGYVVSQPLPADEMAALLVRQSAAQDSGTCAG